MSSHPHPLHALRTRALLPLCLALLSICVCSGCGNHALDQSGTQQTGSGDGAPEAPAPGVVWAFKAREHFIASPVLDGSRLYVSSLGAFNTASFRCLSVGPDAPGRTLWSKGVPFFKIPIVCPPAVADGLIVLGDGMHQTDGAVLHCLRAETGRLAWQFPLPGKLIHIEGTPAVNAGRVYFGGGNAGVLCVELNRVALDGTELDLPAAESILAKRWDELLAKYEEDKKKDPQFAVPPTDDALPKPVPRLVWRNGKDAWHVDAPMAVCGDRILAASAYLDDEKIGRRSLLCLNAADGAVAWEAPLKLNPWAGATVAADSVLVACSSIRFDAKQIAGAKGEIVALDPASGAVRWRKDVPGGVLARLIVYNGLALFTATDGKVRAWRLSNGDEAWRFDAKNPFFAGPAVYAGVVYAVDLNGVLYALDPSDGKPHWSLDVTADPAVQSPGMVYDTPAVRDGRVYLGTCNIEGANAGLPCAVLCATDRARSPAHLSGIRLDKARRSITIDCVVAPRKLPTLQEVYPLEVAATFPAPRGQKAHETVVTFEARPSDVHRALEALGLRPGRIASAEHPLPEGPEVRILLALPGFVDGRPRLVPIEKTIIDRRTGLPLPPVKWHFTGSAMRQTDPTRPDTKTYGADISGTLITLFPVTDETVIEANLTMNDSQILKLETNRNVLPDEGTPVKLVIEVK